MTSVSNNPRGVGATPQKTAAAGAKPIKLVGVPEDKKLVVKAEMLTQPDPLWCISAGLLGPNARNSARVARVQEGFRKENPAINCAARDFGNVLVAGDELKIPNIDWVAGAAGAPKARPSNADELTAQFEAQTQQNAAERAERTAKVKTTLFANLQVAASFVNEHDSLNAGQRNLVASLVAQAERLGEPLPISDDDLNRLKLASAETENTNPSDVYGA